VAKIVRSWRGISSRVRSGVVQLQDLTKATRNKDNQTADMIAAIARPLGYWISSSFGACVSLGLLSTSLPSTPSTDGRSSGFSGGLEAIVEEVGCIT
jgi:hypothetical protein